MRSLQLLTIGLLMAMGGVFAESGVTGKVVDPQGHPVPGATVGLETAAGYRLNAMANSEGRYQFGPIPDGVYQLKAEAPGLASISQKLTLAGQTAEQDITLSQFAAQHQLLGDRRGQRLDAARLLVYVEPRAR